MPGPVPDTLPIEQPNRSRGPRGLTAEELGSIQPYRYLAATDRERLATTARRRCYLREEPLFHQDDPSLHLVSIVSGHVKVFRMSPAGKEVILGVFGSGDFVGAAAVYEERPYPASAVALDDADCILLARDALFRLLAERPSFARGLLSGLSRHLVELTRRMSEVSGPRVESRLARLLLRLGQEIGRKERDGLFVPLALSRRNLADMTGTTIETCIRIMSRWNKQGLVVTERDGFRIRDTAGLEGRADA